MASIYTTRTPSGEYSDTRTREEMTQKLNRVVTIVIQ